MVMFNAVAIDGPAGSGKSTIARAVAERLGFLYVDTGAMYRAVVLKAKLLGCDLEDEDLMSGVAEAAEISFDETGTKIILDGNDVSEKIRTPEITAITKYSARVVNVRQRMVELQRAMAADRPVVMEGRDITTVVLKEAKWKFFVTATPEVRAKRRLSDFKAQGHEVDYEQLLTQIIERDASDNQLGPMKEAKDLALRGEGVTLVDTSQMTPEEVISTIVNYVEENR